MDAEKVQRAIDVLSSIQGTSLQPAPEGEGNPQQSVANVPAQSEVQPSVFRGARRRVGASCSRAVEAIRAISSRISLQSSTVRSEQQSNFAPYNRSCKRSAKSRSWTVKIFCLSNCYARKVPVTVAARETLVAAGLGERKVVVPSVDCSWEEFKCAITSEFPKLNSCGGFEFLRCIPNTKDLESISVAIAHSPKLLKSVVGNGRIFIRPIQKDLALDEEHSDSPKIEEKCIRCGVQVPLQELRKHTQGCTLARMRFSCDTSSDSDFEEPPPKSPCVCIVSSSDEDSEKLPEGNSPTVDDSDVTVTERVMVEHAIRLSSSDDNLTVGSDTPTLASVVRGLSKKVSSTSFVMSVRRGYELVDALRNMKRAIFSPDQQLHVKFIGECGEDGGGPLREFWTLLSRSVACSVFVGAGVRRVLLHDAIGLQRMKFLQIGQLMAMSVVQNGSGFAYIAPPVYQYLCGTDACDIEVCSDDVVDAEVAHFIEEISVCSDTDKLRTVCMNGVDMALDAGYTLPITSIDLNGKPELLRTLMLHHTILRNKAVLDQLKEGLSALGVLAAMARNPQLFEPYFVGEKQEPLSADTMKNLLRVIHFSEARTTERPKEEATYMLFLDLLHEVEDSVCQAVTLGQILSFFSGSEYPPPLGFMHSPCIRFSASSEFPMASTCALELTLPSKFYSNEKH